MMMIMMSQNNECLKESNKKKQSNNFQNNDNNNNKHKETQIFIIYRGYRTNIKNKNISAKRFIYFFTFRFTKKNMDPNDGIKKMIESLRKQKKIN